MKTWKKILMTIAGIGILACGAFMLPTVINHYDDEKDINKINYVDSRNIDVFKYDSKKNMADRFTLLKDIYDSGDKPYIMQIPFEPDEEQKEEIQTKVEEELEKWFKTGIGNDLLAFYLNIEEGFHLKGMNLYSIYSDYGTKTDTKITYLEVTLVMREEPNKVIKVYVDSNDYKIYLVSLEQGYVEQYVWDAGLSVYDLLMTNLKVEQMYAMNYIGDKIVKYYELDNSNISAVIEAKIDDRFVCRINSSVLWSAEIDWDSAKEPIIYIGIRGFENQFSNVSRGITVYSETEE